MSEIYAGTELERLRDGLTLHDHDETHDLPGQELDIRGDTRRHMLVISVNNGGGMLMEFNDDLLIRTVGEGALVNAAVIILTEPTLNIGRVYRDVSTPDETLIISTAAIG